VRIVLQFDFEIDSIYVPFGSLGPFNKTQGLLVKVITIPKILEFFRVAQAIQVEVSDREIVEGIVLNQRVSRASNSADNVPGLQRAAHQSRFADAKLTTQGDDTTMLAGGYQASAKGTHLVFILDQQNRASSYCAIV